MDKLSVSIYWNHTNDRYYAYFVNSAESQIRVSGKTRVEALNNLYGRYLTKLEQGEKIEKESRPEREEKEKLCLYEGPTKENSMDKMQITTGWKDNAFYAQFTDCMLNVKINGQTREEAIQNLYNHYKVRNLLDVSLPWNIESSEEPAQSTKILEEDENLINKYAENKKINNLEFPKPDPKGNYDESSHRTVRLDDIKPVQPGVAVYFAEKPTIIKNAKEAAKLTEENNDTTEEKIKKGINRILAKVDSAAKDGKHYIIEDISMDGPLKLEGDKFVYVYLAREDTMKGLIKLGFSLNSNGGRLEIGW